MEPLSLLVLLKGAAVAGLGLAFCIVLARLLGKQQWFVVWVKRPFLFTVFSAAVWLFFRLAGLAALERYAIALLAAALLGGIVHIVVAFIFTVFFSRQRDIHLPPLLRNVILSATYLTILLVALKIAVPGFSLSPLVLASGVLSLVVGLALQDVLSNLIAGVTLSVERPFRVDDWVSIAGQEGKVVEITWRTTKIQTRQNDYVIIPNRTVAERELRNFVYPNKMHRPIIEIGLPYSTLPSIAEEALIEAAKKVPGVLERPAPRVVLQSFDESSITYGLVIAIDDYDSDRRIQSEVRKEIYYALKRYGVVIPFPIRTIHLHRSAPPVEEWKEAYRHRLQAILGPKKGEIFPLADATVRIGRGEECEINLHDPAVSKEHVRIGCEDGRYFVEDAGSKYGTLVNGRKVERARLRSGDEITIGESVFRFEAVEFE